MGGIAPSVAQLYVRMCEAVHLRWASGETWASGYPSAPNAQASPPRTCASKPCASGLVDAKMHDNHYTRTIYMYICQEAPL